MGRQSPEATLNDEVDELVAQLDAADLALGRHLVDGLIGVAARGGCPPRPLSADWYRTRILGWCHVQAAQDEFDAEAIQCMAMAVEHMDDHNLRALGAQLLSHAVTPAPPTAPVRGSSQATRGLGR